MSVQQDQEDQQGRVGPFVTYIERVRPNGAVARWESRDHRKHLKAGLVAGSTWWAPRARGWWIAVLFAIGSLLFALGAVAGYASAVGASWDAVTFFTGSLFFTGAGFLTYREAVDADPQPPGRARRRFFVFQPGRSAVADARTHRGHHPRSNDTRPLRHLASKRPPPPKEHPTGHHRPRGASTPRPPTTSTR